MVDACQRPSRDRFSEGKFSCENVTRGYITRSLATLPEDGKCTCLLRSPRRRFPEAPKIVVASVVLHECALDIKRFLTQVVLHVTGYGGGYDDRGGYDRY